MAKIDFYNLEARWNKLKEKLENAREPAFSKQNAQAVLKFLTMLQAENASPGRLVKCFYHLKTSARILNKNFLSCTKDDLIEYAGTIETRKTRTGKRYNPATLSDFKSILKNFYQHVRGDEDPLVIWLYKKTNRYFKKSITRHEVKEPRWVSRKDLKQMVQACKTFMDRALVFVAFDSACRPSELLGLNLADIKPNGSEFVLSVPGKTGSRQVPIIESAQALASWLNNHPQKDDPKSSV